MKLLVNSHEKKHADNLSENKIDFEWQKFWVEFISFLTNFVILLSFLLLGNRKVPALNDIENDLNALENA